MKQWHWPSLAALGLIVSAVAFTFPGDAPCVNDEVNLLNAAWRDNHHPSATYGLTLPFTLAPFGLEGNYGVRYGPLSVWIYQLLFLLTTNFITMLALRAFLVGAVTAIALAWLARRLGLNPWLSVVVMLSPWMCFYSRQLWDNSFAIPFSAMTLAAYADFLATHRRWTLTLAICCAIATVLIHLMALALVVPISLHLVFMQTRRAWRSRWLVGLIFLAWAAIAWPYWSYLYEHLHHGSSPSPSAWKGWLFPLMGPPHLAATQLGAVLGKDWLASLPAFPYYLAAFCQFISHLAQLAVWLGMLLAIGRTIAIKRNDPKGDINHLPIIALAIVICQCVLDGVQRAYDQPHYFNATWIAFAVLAGLALRELGRWCGKRCVGMLAGIQASALLVVLATAGWVIHNNGGTRSLGYGVTLAGQISAAEQIGQFSDQSPCTITFEQWERFPGFLILWRRMNPPPSELLPTRKLIVRYRDAFPTDAHIVVEDDPL